MQAVIKNKVKKSLLSAQHFNQSRASAIPPKASYVPSPKEQFRFASSTVHQSTSQELALVRSPQQDSFMNESIPFSPEESAKKLSAAKKHDVMEVASATVASTNVSAMPQTEANSSTAADQLRQNVTALSQASRLGSDMNVSSSMPQTANNRLSSADAGKITVAGK